MRKLSLSIPHVRVRLAHARPGWPICGVAGSWRRAKGAATRRRAPQPAVPHRRERFAHAGATGEKAFTCLDVLNNARTNFNEPLSDGAEVRLVEGLVSGMVQRMQSSRRARFGRRHKCAIGPVHQYYTDELRFIRWHGNSPCARPWSVT